MTYLKTALAVSALVCVAQPAFAQEEPEQPRTTWRIQMIDLKDDAGTKWEDLIMERVIPAYRAAGLPEPQLHWTMANGDYDYVVIGQMPGGMGTFDHHQPAARVALNNALVASLGSEEAVEAMFTELDGYVEDVQTVFTHTHP
jgi:hypothetical protein